MRSLFLNLAMLIAGLLPAYSPLLAQEQYLRFAIVALADNSTTRLEFESQLVNRLVEDRYDAVASYHLVPDMGAQQTGLVRNRLLEAGVNAVLILRPLEMPEGVPLSPQQLQMSADEFTSMSRFISAYRGDNYDVRTVVQIAGFLLDRQASHLFWHGVLWLDETVETEQNRIDKLVDLVQFNLNNSRSALRAQLGLPPLPTGR